jgi:hypothetical protein
MGGKENEFSIVAYKQSIAYKEMQKGETSYDRVT